MSNNKSFNQQEYVKRYVKEHYKEYKVRLKPEISAKIESFCAASGTSKNSFFAAAAAAYIAQNSPAVKSCGGGDP